MLHCISVFDLPRISDKHYGDRDLALVIHTSPMLRHYRDCFIEHHGPDWAYDQIFRALYRALRAHFYEVYAQPYFELHARILELVDESMMDAIFAAAHEMTGTLDRFEKRIEETIAEVAGNRTAFPLAKDDHYLAPLRRLHALYGAVAAERLVPFAPRVADIVSQTLGNECVVPLHEPCYELSQPDTRREVRRIMDTYGFDKGAEVMRALMPPNEELCPEWDVGELLQRVFAEIVTVYFERCNDDAYLEAIIIDRIKPELDPYIDPWDQYYRDMKTYVPELTDEKFARILEKRMWQVRYKDTRTWIAQAESCGYPIDTTWIDLSPDEPAPQDEDKAE
jgi:hypothetical protein